MIIYLLKKIIIGQIFLEGNYKIRKCNEQVRHMRTSEDDHEGGKQDKRKEICRDTRKLV